MTADACDHVGVVIAAVFRAEEEEILDLIRDQPLLGNLTGHDVFLDSHRYEPWCVNDILRGHLREIDLAMLEIEEFLVVALDSRQALTAQIRIEFEAIEVPIPLEAGYLEDMVTIRSETGIRIDHQIRGFPCSALVTEPAIVARWRQVVNRSPSDEGEIDNQDEGYDSPGHFEFETVVMSRENTDFEIVDIVVHTILRAVVVSVVIEPSEREGADKIRQ